MLSQFIKGDGVSLREQEVAESPLERADPVQQERDHGVVLSLARHFAVAAPDLVPVELAIELHRQEEAEAVGQAAADLVDIVEYAAHGVFLVPLGRR